MSVGRLWSLIISAHAGRTRTTVVVGAALLVAAAAPARGWGEAGHDYPRNA